ncbi:MAG: hypothetical protein U0800_18665 [Isosphaeraceae bacterium]
MDDPLNLSMFRAYDIRTPSGPLTDELAQRLSFAEARYFREVLDAPGVLLARDARSTGPHYLEIAADAYRSAGLDVILIPGVSSTSLFYHAAMRHPKHAAVMVGASHNPAGDTGRKLLAPGVVPIARGIGPGGGLDRIREFHERGERPAPSATRGRIRAEDPTDAYIAYSMDLAGVSPGGLEGVRVFQDHLNGAAGREMLLAFGRAGARLEPFHFEADGRFPLGDPNPVKPSVIAPGLAALKAGDYRAGMFFDGDGDRLDIYGGDGRYLSSSFVYAAILPEIRGRFPGPGRGIFADLKCNPLALIEMARSGVAVDVIRNGHSQIKESLLRDEARFGAVEESAHFYEAFPLDGARYCTENTLYLALLVARAWSEDPGRFDRLFDIQATTARAREWGYKFPDESARDGALEAVRELLEGEGFRSMHRMKNGMDLEATLIRRGLPFDIDESSRLERGWLQVCQRTSQSEDGLARWEVVGDTADDVGRAKRAIAECARRFGAGDEYQG